MESLNFHNIKVEKANAMLRYKKRQRVTTLFRMIELCILFVIISRFSTQLPLTFKLSTEYFRGLGVTLISPRFVFLLGNSIVVILFLKSGQSPGSPNNVKIDLYDEYKQKCSISKESYCEQSNKQSKQGNLVQQSKKQSVMVERQVENKIHRSHSENFIRLSHEEKKPKKELIRSATVRIYSDSAKEVRSRASYPEDKMSGEEFRKTVEAFIARQQRLLMEEEFSAVVSYES